MSAESRGLRPAVAAVVRAAQAFLAAAEYGGDHLAAAGRDLDAVIGRQLLNVPRRDRRQFIATLALVAADFAVELPPPRRAAIFAKLDSSDAELAGQAVGILLTDPTGGVRRPQEHQ